MPGAGHTSCTMRPFCWLPQANGSPRAALHSVSTTSSRHPAPIFSAMSQPVGVGSRSWLSGSPDSTATSVSSDWIRRKNWRTLMGSDSATVLACAAN